MTRVHAFGDDVLGELQLDGGQYPTRVWEAGTYEGVRYGVPLDVHSLASYANMQLLGQADLDQQPSTGEELQQAPAALGDPPEGGPQRPVALVPEQARVDSGLPRAVRRQRPHVVGRHVPAPAAQVAQGFVARRHGEPAPEALRVPDGIEVLQEPQPRGLDDVGRRVGGEAIATGDPPEERAEAVDQLVPRRLIAVPQGGVQAPVGVVVAPADRIGYEVPVVGAGQGPRRGGGARVAARGGREKCSNRSAASSSTRTARSSTSTPPGRSGATG